MERFGDATEKTRNATYDREDLGREKAKEILVLSEQ